MSAMQTGFLAGLGVLVGAGAGFFIHSKVADPVEIIVEKPQLIKEELSVEDLAALCEDNVKPARESLYDAQARVEELEASLASREAELAELKAVVEEDESKKAAAIQRWRAMEAEIEDLKSKLTTAEGERDQLMEDLKDTIYKLEVQIKETEKAKAEAKFYKNEATVNLWSAFSAEAKVEICDRGSRRRHEKCHEAVELAIDGYKDRFAECVDSWQAIPVLVQGDKRQREDLPSFAEWLSEDERFTKKGWYVQFCDPTLPEAGGNTASPVPVSLDD